MNLQDVFFTKDKKQTILKNPLLFAVLTIKQSLVQLPIF